MNRELTPKQIVAELNKYIVGQNAAKKAVAIALRNRIRRQKLAPEMMEEVAPKNIVMIGPTGVGKTEIAKRLSNLADAPFLKVEASKYTEVGYVGRDVESMVRDLVSVAVNMVMTKKAHEVEARAKAQAEKRIVDILIREEKAKRSREQDSSAAALAAGEGDSQLKGSLVDQLRKGLLDEHTVEIEVEASIAPVFEIFTPQGIESVDFNFQELFSKIAPRKTKKSKMKISTAMRMLTQEESQKLVDMDSVTKDAIRKAEDSGIIFIDELDKIAGREKGGGPDVSREGVQRDLLPIIEGTNVPTKYGQVRTNHMLFIAAGAFHVSKPSDLIPELQGRFPIRVELSSLGKEDFVRILKEPRNALIKQYVELLKTEGVELVFEEDAIDEIADIAAAVNESAQNIGARRLHTVMEKLLEDVSFEAPDLKEKNIRIDRKYVKEKLSGILENRDLSRYIL